MKTNSKLWQRREGVIMPWFYIHIKSTIVVGQLQSGKWVIRYGINKTYPIEFPNEFDAMKVADAMFTSVKST